jgi:hypothetical protein
MTRARMEETGIYTVYLMENVHYREEKDMEITLSFTVLR